MARSQRVAQYISDGESNNDMELESSNNGEDVQKQTKKIEENWFRYAHTTIKMMLLIR
jgi:hypothetical protein